ncbi:MAG: ComEA family DNA-binding protein [Planctomycetota bacterium]
MTPAEFLTNASVHELRSLPGIGPARALALARWRWQHDGVLTVADLEAVPNIGPETRAAIEAALVVHTDRTQTPAIRPAR